MQVTEVFCTMPEGATLATNWCVRGAYEDVTPIDSGSWRFPFGTNGYSSLWAFTWGKLRFVLGDAETEIVAVGVTFDLGDRIVVTNIPAAYDINEAGSANGRWDIDRLTGLASNTGGLECYFVNSITHRRDNGGLATLLGLHVSSGLAVAGSGGGVILAHELGHAFGLSDIYRKDEAGNPLAGLTCKDYWLDDWNGGSDSRSQGSGAERYYRKGTQHGDVIGLLLMDGRKSDPGKGLDISYGGAYGYGTDDMLGDQDTGFFSPERSGDPTHR